MACKVQEDVVTGGRDEPQRKVGALLSRTTELGVVFCFFEFIERCLSSAYIVHHGTALQLRCIELWEGIARPSTTANGVTRVFGLIIQRIFYWTVLSPPPSPGKADLG